MTTPMRFYVFGEVLKHGGMKSLMSMNIESDPLFGVNLRVAFEKAIGNFIKDKPDATFAVIISEKGRGMFTEYEVEAFLRTCHDKVHGLLSEFHNDSPKQVQNAS